MTAIEDRLTKALGGERVVTDPRVLEDYAGDMTENKPVRPGAVVRPTTVEQVQAVVRIANETRTPLTPRVAGTNLGGLTIPAPDGIVIDLSGMKRVFEVNDANMFAIIEPGVTWEGLKTHLEENGHDLILGYPLSPPDSSIVANCLLDGLVNLSLVHGTMSEWVNGLEVVLPSGRLMRTGAGSVSDVWFSRAPLPDLTGLFISWQGTTGITTKLSLQLWPRPVHRRRFFLLTHDRAGAFASMRRLSRQGLCDDIGGLSWPAGKMLFGVPRPGPRDPAEPEFFLYLDVSGATRRLLTLKGLAIQEALKSVGEEGLKVEGPIEIDDLLKLEPRFAKFADFPTRLDFLLDYPGGGLTWIGTYGPIDRLEEASDEGVKVMERHEEPPTMVSRPMKGGHFAVLRYITLFDRSDPADIERVRSLQRELCEVALRHGFIPYKTPPWAVPRLLERMDPAARELMVQVQKLLDPNGIMNPGKWGFR